MAEERRARRQAGERARTATAAAKVARTEAKVVAAEAKRQQRRDSVDSGSSQEAAGRGGGPLDPRVGGSISQEQARLGGVDDGCHGRRARGVAAGRWLRVEALPSLKRHVGLKHLPVRCGCPEATF